MRCSEHAPRSRPLLHTACAPSHFSAVPAPAARVAELAVVRRRYALPVSESHEDTAGLDIWWAVPGVLGGMSMPFIHPQRHDTPGAVLDAFADELPALWHTGIRAIVCLLNMPSAAGTYSAAGFAFHLLPLADGAAPTAEEFQQFLAFVASQRSLGHPVAVHCEAGIGRTGTLLAGYLVASGFTPDAAVAHVRSLRRGAVETTRQLQFLHDTYSAINRDA